MTDRAETAADILAKAVTFRGITAGELAKSLSPVLAVLKPKPAVRVSGLSVLWEDGRKIEFYGSVTLNLYDQHACTVQLEWEDAGQKLAYGFSISRSLMPDFRPSEDLWYPLRRIVHENGLEQKGLARITIPTKRRT